MPPDALDLAILEALRRDARTPHAAIGREVGLTGPAVLARIRRMEETRTIRGYRVDVDPDLHGAGLRAICRVVTRPTEDDRAFETFVAGEPRIAGCYDVDGEDSFVLMLRCRDPKDLQGLLLRLRGLPTVRRTITNIVLDTVKEAR